ncbi:DUF3667 domain-containing protein [Chitinophaga varians]|uniref:DUF3667 domain-containing protein n=1 Tax=Chitinophaga varians TaxID=2202339 RepID=A0A847RXD5_9BACT|nr:DUF3667 domain-containing protein [Chitinophaga varians]NLR66624.1 DUF3667 domain-containing protein [Chitinophaga varians]
MKSQHLRSEKNCLNCGTEVPERYCPLCGQENTVQHESFGHLVGHVVADIVHYDSQLLATLKYLTIRPGFLTTEYWAGRRVRYVNPIKLYIFISAVFFFFFLTLAGSQKDHNARPGIQTDLVDMEVGDIGSDYKSVAEYDSAQAAKPANKRYTGLEDRMQRRLARMRENKQSAKEVIREMFTHNLPKIMFILMPLFALLVKWTHRKRHLVYVDHAIFTVHVHSFLFIILFVGLVVRYFVHDDLPLDLAYWGVFFYLVFALKNAYQQSFWKSLLKALLLYCGYFTVAVILFVAFLFGVLASF